MHFGRVYPGWLADLTGFYTAAFYLSGVVMVIAGVIMLIPMFLQKHKPEEVAVVETGEGPQSQEIDIVKVDPFAGLPDDEVVSPLMSEYVYFGLNSFQCNHGYVVRLVKIYYG